MSSGHQGADRGMTGAPCWTLVVAMSRNGVIGAGGRLPWHLPADLRHFKEITLGKPVVMGRRTWESIGQPLPGRLNLVVTRQPGYLAEGAGVLHSLDEVAKTTGQAPEIMLIGGAELYQAALPRVRRMVITRVEAEVEGDVLFPEVSWNEWDRVSHTRREPDEKNLLAMVFEVWERKT